MDEQPPQQHHLVQVFLLIGVLLLLYIVFQDRFFIQPVRDQTSCTKTVTSLRNSTLKQFDKHIQKILTTGAAGAHLIQPTPYRINNSGSQLLTPVWNSVGFSVATDTSTTELSTPTTTALSAIDTAREIQKSFTLVRQAINDPETASSTQAIADRERTRIEQLFTNMQNWCNTLPQQAE